MKTWKLVVGRRDVTGVTVVLAASLLSASTAIAPGSQPAVAAIVTARPLPLGALPLIYPAEQSKISVSPRSDCVWLVQEPATC